MINLVGELVVFELFCHKNLSLVDLAKTFIVELQACKKKHVRLLQCGQHSYSRSALGVLGGAELMGPRID